MFSRFLATTLGTAFSLTLIVGTLVMAGNSTRPLLADDQQAATATNQVVPDPGALEIIDKKGQAAGSRATVMPESGTKYRVGGKEFTWNIRNPRLSDVPFLVLWIIEFLVGISGVVAVFYLIYGGFQYFYELRHPGSGPSQGKGTVYHAILGLVIVMISYIFIATIVGGITGY